MATVEFSLAGGPLHRLGCRLGLVQHGTNSFRLGLAFGLLSWGVLALLTLLMGVGSVVFSLSLIGAHVRLLVAIPLFFLCETWVLPRMAEFVRHIVHSGLVPETEVTELEAAIRRVGRGGSSWLAEGLLVLVVFALPLLTTANALGKSGSLALLLAETGGRVGPLLAWYLWFCLPLFRFLLLRWLWRLALWCYFLWRVQRLELHLMPTHPDGVAGLGYLEIVQAQFCPLVSAIAAVLSASFAEAIFCKTIAFEALYSLISMLLLLVAVLFVAPLIVFSRRLWQCRMVGLLNYWEMASRYVNDYDRKWIRGVNPSGESLLGTGDIQSLADLNNSVSIPRDMRIIPVSCRLLAELAAAALLPLLPLLLLKYPVDPIPPTTPRSACASCRRSTGRRRSISRRSCGWARPRGARACGCSAL